MVGVGVVIVMHIILGWALLNGLARKVVEVVKGPIETKIIEEVKPPPPPPPENLPPPPKLPPPPPAFMPPPEVQIQNPPPRARDHRADRAAAASAAGDDRAAAGARAAPPAPPAPAARARPAIANFNDLRTKPRRLSAGRARAEATGLTRIKVHGRRRWQGRHRDRDRQDGQARRVSTSMLDRAAERRSATPANSNPGRVDGKPAAADHSRRATSGSSSSLRAQSLRSRGIAAALRSPQRSPFVLEEPCR